MNRVFCPRIPSPTSNQRPASELDLLLSPTSPFPGETEDWAGWLAGIPSEDAEELRRHTRTGRPLGDEGFVRRLERLLGRSLAPKKPGRPRKKPVERE
ncbi:hypothetical protein KQI84_15850 [bacterium]|nr:hypothetical protein [bacterium]